jgi:SAM-dependent methyltransferase
MQRRAPFLSTTHDRTTFRGLVECTAPGLHDAAFSLFARHVPLSASVIDLGSGEGAWALRLACEGFDVQGFDVVPRDEGPIPVRAVDLNGDFSHLAPGGVDAVTLIEVLEHLENPRHVLREVARMLRPGGTLMLTTPNASGVYSRVRFFFTGELAMFTDVDYEASGHITPITAWYLDKAFRDTDLVLVERRYHDAPFLPPKSFGDVAKIVSWCALRPLMRGAVGGQVVMVVARRSS